MLRFRFLVVLTLSFLAASAAWADEVGYVDCSSHSDPTQVFGKPRRTPDTVASIPCGERFTILVYGFYFSRIQTKDGQIGYIYSSLIAVDRGAAAVQQTTSVQPAAEKAKIPSTRYTEAHVNPPASSQAQPAAPQRSTSTTTGLFPSPPASSASASPASTSLTAAAPATAQDAPSSPTPAASVVSTAAQPDAPATAQPQPTPAQPAAPEVTAATPAAAQNPPEVSAPAEQPPSATANTQPDPSATVPTPAPATAAEPTAAAPVQPSTAEPVPAQPEPAPAPVKPAPAIRPADTHETWEKPNPSVRTPPLIELFGGFAFASMSGGSGYSSTNFTGGLGSFGYNFKPWLQLVGDSSYNFTTVNGTKTILYGNHYGPRYYYRGLSRLHITPFAEAFVGGSRADTTITGDPTTSQNCISFKVGGGIDYRPSRHWEIRLFDFDYYRTSFGTNAHQTNYWASAGIVLRLFGGGHD